MYPAGDRTGEWLDAVENGSVVFDPVHRCVLASSRPTAAIGGTGSASPDGPPRRSSRRAKAVRARPVSVVGRNRNHSHAKVVKRVSRALGKAKVSFRAHRSSPDVPPIAMTRSRPIGPVMRTRRAVANFQRSANTPEYQFGNAVSAANRAGTSARAVCARDVAGRLERVAVAVNTPYSNSLRRIAETMHERDLTRQKPVGERAQALVEPTGRDHGVAPEHGAARQDPIVDVS